MKIKSPIGFLALWSAFLALGAPVQASCAEALRATPPAPEPWDPETDCLYARDFPGDIVECMPDIQWEICDCEPQSWLRCCRGKLVSGGVLLRHLWVWGDGRGYRRQDWEYGPRETVFQKPLCPLIEGDDCRLAPPQSIYCGRGWALNPDGALPCD